MSYLITAVRDGKRVSLGRNSVEAAFGAVTRLRQLGYEVRVRRPGSTTLEAEVERAVTS